MLKRTLPYVVPVFLVLSVGAVVADTAAASHGRGARDKPAASATAQAGREALKRARNLCYLSAAEASAIVGATVDAGKPRVPKTRIEGGGDQIGYAACDYSSRARTAPPGRHELEAVYDVSILLIGPSELGGGRCTPEAHTTVERVTGGCLELETRGSYTYASVVVYGVRLELDAGHV